MDSIKIPIMGIDNSGKTSLIKTFQREFKSLSKIKATKGIERSKLKFLDKEVVIWDFGGQAKYREKYFRKSELNFSDFEECFYIIDVQDQDSFNFSISYFESIKKAMEEFAPDATINIIINKMDPGMDEDPEYIMLAKIVEEKFKDLAKPFPTRIYQTSIFNPISVIHALSKAVVGNSILMDNFDVVFSEFVEKNDSADMIHFIIVYSEKFLEIGRYFSEKVNQEKMSKIAPEMFSTFDDDKFKLNMVDFALKTGTTTIQITKFSEKDKDFFFCIGIDNEKMPNLHEIKPEIENLKIDVKKIMLYF